ncbi:nuclear transport factor 2 family protein [Nocardia sp. NPDC050697]|uniref:nuclear transport factor 2 family protein n=1 Tax=Nocardia sp. NPDC050697 TaxID=3155158 RepID=UPI0033FC3EDD
MAALWVEDGVYDVDSGYLAGHGELAAMVGSDQHQAFIARGCGHFLTPAHITVEHDHAIAAGHSLLVLRERDAFLIHRVTAHHWPLTRTPDGWRVRRRTSRILDGDVFAHRLLAAGVRGEQPHRPAGADDRAARTAAAGRPGRAS